MLTAIDGAIGSLNECVLPWPRIGPSSCFSFSRCAARTATTDDGPGHLVPPHADATSSEVRWHGKGTDEHCI